MIAPIILHSLFVESFTKVKEHTTGVSHADSVRTLLPGTNCMHWILGHIVVARCNFLMLFNTPSIWDWPTCELFIPGSSPTTESADHISFITLLADLERTQDQLLNTIAQTTEVDLGVMKNEQAIGEHLATYAAHESYHAGQLEILRQVLMS